MFLEVHTGVRSLPEYLHHNIESLLEHLSQSGVLATVSNMETQFASGSIPASTDVCNETICAWLGAAEQGDLVAIWQLRDLCAQYLVNSQVS